MSEPILFQLVIILSVSAVAQWLGWKFKVPAILLLLASGFILGPITGLMDMEALFGDALLPLVSASVAILLFEGGLTLRFKDLKHGGAVIFRLVTVGVVITSVIAGWLAYALLGFPPTIAALFGALLSVTGPTVIGPILRTIRPKGSVRNIAKWEGILNDPVGVLLAVFIYDILILGSEEQMWTQLALAIFKTLAVAFALSWAGSRLLIYLVRHRMLPDFLHNLTSLAIVLGTFFLSNVVQHEAGLVTATLLGIFLANQRDFRVDHIIHFKENLTVLIISFVFIVLAANVKPEVLQLLDWRHFVFLVALIVIARPLSILASTIGTGTPMNQSVLLMLLAPRGIVALSLTSVFVLKLKKAGFEEADELFASMLVVVVGTVIFYGSTVAQAASRLKLSELAPSGLLFVGAAPWAIHLGKKLQQQGVFVHFIDSNRDHVAMAREKGLSASTGDVLSNVFLEEQDFSEIGHVLCATTNYEVNTLAKQMLMEFFDRRDILVIEPDHVVHNKEDERKRPFDPAFGSFVTHNWLEAHVTSESAINTREVPAEASNVKDLLVGVVPLFVLSEDKKELKIFTQKYRPNVKPGQIAIGLLDAGETGEAQ
ncbi:MAG: cation:proton antiporter [Opitutales bacterium]|nr:cation:proton antiporter [Opitutales bacterium]NRA27030.1 sodium:proton antiporter [Opitutales bacterium]